MLLNPYRFGSAAPSALYWSTTDKGAGMAVSTDTKTAWRTAAIGSHQVVRGALGRSTGKRYVEFYSPQARSQIPGQGVNAGLVTAAFPLSGFAPGETSGGTGVLFRRYLSTGNSAWITPNGAAATNINFDVASVNGWTGLAIDMATSGMWINIDGTWMGGKSPASHPSSPFTVTWTGGGAFYPATSTYYPIGTYPDNSVTLRVLASEMSIGATAFNPGQVLDGFLPWGV